MNIKRHGLSVGIERTNDQFFLSLKVQGKLTHKDYETITPMLDSALAEVKTPTISVLFDGTEFEGWEARAAWDDFKLGIKHRSEFKKIAIYGDKGWQKLAATVGNWFISGDVQYFENCKDALLWLEE